MVWSDRRNMGRSARRHPLHPVIPAPADQCGLVGRGHQWSYTVRELEQERLPFLGAFLPGDVADAEQDELDVNITAKLPASANSFSVPNGFLRPGTEYQLGIGTVSKDGNISYIETHFTTVPR
jgi:hypothetical protein